MKEILLYESEDGTTFKDLKDCLEHDAYLYQKNKLSELLNKTLFSKQRRYYTADKLTEFLIENKKEFMRILNG